MYFKWYKVMRIYLGLYEFLNLVFLILVTDTVKTNHIQNQDSVVVYQVKNLLNYS